MVAGGEVRGGSGAPDDRVGLESRAVVPGDAPARESGEHGLCVQVTACTGVADAGNHHDVAESCYAGVSPTLPYSFDARCGGRE